MEKNYMVPEPGREEMEGGYRANGNSSRNLEIRRSQNYRRGPNRDKPDVSKSFPKSIEQRPRRVGRILEHK